MNFRLETNGKVYIVIKYTKWEWERLEDILKNKLKLQKRKIINGWGKGYSFYAYVEDDIELKRMIDNSVSVPNIYDDLNLPLTRYDHINIAAFRVIPDKNLEIKIALDKFVIASELKKFFDTIKQVYKFLFEITLDADVDIIIREAD